MVMSMGNEYRITDDDTKQMRYRIVSLAWLENKADILSGEASMLI